MIYNYTCALGYFCQSNELLSNAKLKRESYPFDHMNSSPAMIIHCLSDNFEKFLDKQYYTYPNHTENQSHTFYNPKGSYVFNHHNLLKDHDYAYFTRCVERFLNLLKKENPKLFVIFYNSNNINRDFNYSENVEDDIKNLDIELQKYTSNYTILCIINNHGHSNNHHFETIGNIDFLYFTTVSHHKGDVFYDGNTNVLLDSIFQERYKFDILEPDSKKDLNIF